MEIQEILEKVKTGAMSVEEAEGFLRREPFEEMGYAKLDMHRKVRSGFAEVIYCAGKADEHLLHIFEHLYKADGQVFGTRATQHQYEILREKYPQVEYDPISHIIKIEKKDKEHIGNIAVCTAGTADIAVANKQDFFHLTLPAPRPVPEQRCGRTPGTGTAVRRSLSPSDPCRW